MIYGISLVWNNVQLEPSQTLFAYGYCEGEEITVDLITVMMLLKYDF